MYVSRITECNRNLYMDIIIYSYISDFNKIHTPPKKIGKEKNISQPFRFLSDQYSVKLMCHRGEK